MNVVSKELFLGCGIYRCNTTVGIEHMIFFAPCGCDSFAITLARAKLWPATPHNSHLAFTFALPGVPKL